MLQLLKITKGRDQVIDELGFLYSKKLTNSTHVVWACRVRNCNAIGHTPLGYVNRLEGWELIFSHNHILNPETMRRKFLIMEMKKLCRGTMLSPRNVLNQVLGEKTREDVRILGDCETVYRTL